MRPIASFLIQSYYMKSIKAKIQALETKLSTDFQTYKKLHPKTKKTPSDPLFHIKQQGYDVKEGKAGLGHDFSIEAHHPEHGLVGKATFKANSTGTKLIPVHVAVKPEHQRKGLGNAMYAHAEKIYETPIVNKATHQTPAAQAMWSSPNRSFGKTKKK